MPFDHVAIYEARAIERNHLLDLPIDIRLIEISLVVFLSVVVMDLHALRAGITQPYP
jgi:hypothetical protein